MKIFTLAALLFTGCLQQIDCVIPNPELDEGEHCKKVHGYCCYFFQEDEKGHATDIVCEDPVCECPTPTVNICVGNE